LPYQGQGPAARAVGEVGRFFAVAVAPEARIEAAVGVEAREREQLLGVTTTSLPSGWTITAAA
jgi:hypothetical protein